MDIPDFSILAPEESAQVALGLPATQFAAAVGNFSSDQLQATVVGLIPGRDRDWQAKVRALLPALNHRQQLEAVGRVLSPDQVMELLEVCANDSSGLIDKFQFILVGLPQSAFETVLQWITQPQLRVLKELGPTESLQHHLTLLIHELARLAENHAIGIEELERQIDTYDVTRIEQEEIDIFLHRIEETISFFHQRLFVIDTALALAWNTNREDLIVRLTQLKENWLRYLQFVIGRPADHEHVATALYARLETKLGSIYGTPGSLEALSNEDPAIEALAALSLWVLQDYWEVGLIPGIASIDQLDLDTHAYTEKERAHFREKLALMAQENLSAIGLASVRDLKRAHIYSKQMLKRYIQQHHRQMTNVDLRAPI